MVSNICRTVAPTGKSKELLQGPISRCFVTLQHRPRLTENTKRQGTICSLQFTPRIKCHICCVQTEETKRLVCLGCVWQLSGAGPKPSDLKQAAGSLLPSVDDNRSDLQQHSFCQSKWGISYPVILGQLGSICFTNSHIYFLNMVEKTDLFSDLMW